VGLGREREGKRRNKVSTTNLRRGRGEGKGRPEEGKERRLTSRAYRGERGRRQTLINFAGRGAPRKERKRKKEKKSRREVPQEGREGPARPTLHDRLVCHKGGKKGKKRGGRAKRAPSIRCEKEGRRRARVDDPGQRFLAPGKKKRGKGPHGCIWL